MSLVSVDELAEYVWKTVESSKSGVLHPQLTYRCRQKEFADIVHEVTSKKTQRIGIVRRQRMEVQMRESVLASIRLDDGLANQSESQANRKSLNSLIEEIYTGFS
jgi:dTDP-4-dehydrorhamnose reductase